MEGLPEEAKDYVAVIAKKSDRLNKLTQDLFDISKVQSGERTVSRLNKVTGDARVEELMRMLGTGGENARAHAMDLLQND